MSFFDSFKSLLSKSGVNFEGKIISGYLLFMQNSNIPEALNLSSKIKYLQGEGSSNPVIKSLSFIIVQLKSNIEALVKLGMDNDDEVSIQQYNEIPMILFCDVKYTIVQLLDNSKMVQILPSLDNVSIDDNDDNGIITIINNPQQNLSFWAFYQYKFWATYSASALSKSQIYLNFYNQSKINPPPQVSVAQVSVAQLNQVNPPTSQNYQNNDDIIGVDDEFEFADKFGNNHSNNRLLYQINSQVRRLLIDVFKHQQPPQSKTNQQQHQQYQKYNTFEDFTNDLIKLYHQPKNGEGFNLSM